MSQEKKYQVFISSTYTDLVEAREKATKVILDLYHLPVGMEMFSADDDDQWKIITDAIDVSDYYVLILGHRYGSLTNKGISFTEKEFNYAKSKNIPILSFIRHRDTPVSNSDRESNPKSLDKLEKFIAKASKGKMCAFWTDVSDLERQLAIALPKSFARHQGIGWVRGDSKSEHVAEEIAKLSEENRKLRDEINAYEKEKETREPNLKLYITNTEFPDLNFKLNYSKQLDLYTIRYPIVVDELDVDILEDLTGEIIDDFNKRISKITSEDIEQYNLISKKIDMLKYSRFPLSLFLMNTGNLKANNVIVHVEIPSFLLVIEEKDDSKVNEMVDELLKERLKIIPAPAYDPISQIVQKRSRKMNISRPFAVPYSSINRPHLSAKKFDGPNKDFLIDDDRTIYIKKSEMIHQSKRGSVYEDYTLIPTGTGTGVIRVNLMCEEYLEERIYEFPITVE